MLWWITELQTMWAGSCMVREPESYSLFETYCQHVCMLLNSVPIAGEGCGCVNIIVKVWVGVWGLGDVNLCCIIFLYRALAPFRAMYVTSLLAMIVYRCSYPWPSPNWLKTELSVIVFLQCYPRPSPNSLKHDSLLAMLPLAQITDWKQSQAWWSSCNATCGQALMDWKQSEAW
jgi:hypothetical protein